MWLTVGTLTALEECMKNTFNLKILTQFSICLILGFSFSAHAKSKNRKPVMKRAAAQAKSEAQSQSQAKSVANTKKIVSIQLEPAKKSKKIRTKRKVTSSKKKIVRYASDVSDTDVEPLTPDQQARLEKQRQAEKKSRKIASEDSLNKEGMPLPEKIHNPLDDQQTVPAPSLKKLVNEYKASFEDEADIDDAVFDEPSTITSKDVAIAQ